MFKSNVRALSTTAVPLTPPSSATDYRSGCSVIIQCTSAILVGGADAQTFQVAANTPFPINEMDPGELPYVKVASGTPDLNELWQGLGG